MTMQKIQHIKLAILSIIILFTTNTLAQSEVDVVKPYEPAIKDAFKISKMPQILDTATTNVSLEYNINPLPFVSFFKPEKINPAKMKSEVDQIFNRGFVRAGIGTYISPLLDVRLHSLQSTNYQWSTYLLHNSVNGKITNQYDKRQFAGFSSNAFGVNGKKILPTATAYADINFKNRKSYYFGRTLDDDSEDVRNTEYEKKDMEALAVNNFKTRIGINSTHMDSANLNYKLFAQFKHTNTKNNIKEDKTDIGADLDYYFNHQFIGTQGTIKYIQNTGLIDTLEHIYIDFNPWIGAFGKKWRIQIGINTTYDQKTAEYFFFPNVKLHYNIASFIMVPYFEYAGNYQLNTYQKISDENHFIHPAVYVKPTIYRNIISGGLRGNISSRLGFNLNGTWKRIDDQYFYMDADSTNATQYFDVTYDNLDHMRLLAEVSWKKSEKFNLIVQAAYNQYTLDSLTHPYYMPVYEINTHFMYNIKNKIILTSDLFFKGERYAHDLKNGDQKLKDVLDLNIGAEYRYNDYLSGFVQLNNILAQKRYEWLNYRLLGFHAIVGATYKF